MTHLPAMHRLYVTSTAPNPRRVLAFLAEKGVEVELVELDMGRREHYDPEYVARAGAPVIPALELENGEFLTESVAICRYVEALHPEPNLMGRDGLEAARIEMWQRRVEFGLLLPVGFVFRHSHPSMAGFENQVPEWAEANRPRVLAGLEMLDRRLSSAPFVAGERFTIADITAWLAIDFMRVTRIAPPEELEALRRWHARLADRPGFQRPARPARKQTAG
ncbi:glutathione S-transferase family protein [Oceanicella actignis]|uniref:Glutathione S-transferase n=1 Tax=Oceanicella actignis TaxID=1189325 RepID=A0A1M7SBW9_9RHOB|nr:glutathione S-transferase [Oceanicella actignis]TYO91499.1 glutathione S-transferase [Oceanicella actignis]SET26745.1 Glutathione S-transferase [Oceanicella actignis]SHN55958.1 Glutathione S-transferase [Oceanicella actignis]